MYGSKVIKEPGRRSQQELSPVDSRKCVTFGVAAISWCLLKEKMEKKTEGKTVAENNPKPDLVTPFHLLDIPKLAVASANIGTWFLDEETQTFLPSPRMKELFGYSPDEELTFEAVLAQIPDKYRRRVIHTLKEARSKHDPFYIEYPVTGINDQKQRWLRVMGGVDKSTDTSCHFSGVIMDITEQKQNELIRNRFIGMVSHELKTPLTALKAYIQLLNKWATKKKDSFTIGALSKVERQVKKMTTMINGFLNLSVAESGKIQLNKEEFFLNELVVEVIQDHTDVTSNSNIIMTAGLPVPVEADRDKIEQVIVNLLSNAIKYSELGMPVHINCEHDGAMVKLNIKDTGMGIEQQDIKKLFKPHSRIKNSQTQKISGFGIGLYLCAEIIRHHGGYIGVDSEAGKGSTFWFTLPLQNTSTVADAARNH